jgi:eukaryotic-like serine/threonine-protein kinase
MAAPSQLVGHTLGHYHIIEQIGAGGMGVVYRARDEHLERNVAVKVLPVGSLADEAARKRFRKEALTLAKLNHPNIATIFEFGTHGNTDYLVTEYISGLTLDNRLISGALSEKEAVNLGIQLAQGLSVAHEHGIVHRDLKPGNLRLASDGRLKILDFGLAQLTPHASELGMTATLTQSQEVTGTLPYMAPEQLRGEPAEVRTDIWAAGAVLYETATGRRPFEARVPTALAGDIIHKAPLPPRKLRPELSPRLEAVILKCLQKEAINRYQTASELQNDLERLATGVSSISTVRKWVWPSVAATAAGILATAAVAWFLVVRPGAQSAMSTSHARRSVAVLGFKNLSGRPDVAWLSTAFSEMLTTELAAGGKLRTVPGESISQMKISLALPDADSYGKETLSRIRRNLGTDEVLLGSYLALGDGQVRLDLKLEDASSGEIVDSATASGREAEVADLVSRLGASLRSKLGAGEVSAAEALTVKALLPSNPEAARLYSEGLSKLRSFDYLDAQDLLQKAIAIEPNFALSHSALATASSGVGYDARAQEEGKKAFELSSNLGREERLWVEGQYRETAKQWDKAVEVYGTLFRAYPDNVDYGLRLANVQDSASRPKDALSTVEVLRKLPLEAREDPRISVMETQTLLSLGEYQRAQLTAMKAVEEAETRGARLVAARAHLWDCWASINLDQLDRATTSCNAAKRIYAAANDTADMLRVETSIATAQLSQGNYSAAQKIYENVLADARRVGYQRTIGISLGNIGITLGDQGDSAAAKARFEEALSIFLKTDDKFSFAYFSMGLAYVLYNLGDLREAKANLEQSVRMDREIGDKRTMGYAMSELGLMLSASGDLAEASRAYQEALGIWTEFGNQLFVENTQIALAELLTEEGDLEKAESLARSGLDGLLKEKAPADNQAEAHNVLAEALLARGRAEDANREITSAEEAAAASQDRSLRMQINVTSARVLSALGDVSGAKKSLAATIAKARKYHLLPVELDARLASGEAEMHSGLATAGRIHLRALEEDARSKGFLLVARKAAAAAAKS